MVKLGEREGRCSYIPSFICFRIRIMELLNKLRSNRNYIYIYITHNIDGFFGWLDTCEPSLIFLHLFADNLHGIESAATVGINIVCGICK